MSFQKKQNIDQFFLDKIGIDNYFPILELAHRESFRPSLDRIKLMGKLLDFYYELKIPMRYSTIIDECMNIFNAKRYTGEWEYMTDDINGDTIHIRNESDQDEIYYEFYFPYIRRSYILHDTTISNKECKCGSIVEKKIINL